MTSKPGLSLLEERNEAFDAYLKALESGGGKEATKAYFAVVNDPKDDLIFMVGWFVILCVVFAPILGLLVLLDWLVIPG